MKENRRILFLDTDKAAMETLVNLLSRSGDYKLKDFSLHIEDDPEKVLVQMKTEKMKYDIILCEYNLTLNCYEFLSRAKQLDAYKSAILYSEVIDDPKGEKLLLRELINEKLISKLIDKSCGPGMAVSEIIATIDDLYGTITTAIENISEKLIIDEEFTFGDLRKKIIHYLKSKGHSTTSIASSLGITRPTVYADLKE